MQVFAEDGYYKATTAQVAEVAGISQPYVYRFFETKEALFLAALDRSIDRIRTIFDAVQGKPNELMEEMGQAYKRLMKTHPNEIILQLQAQVVSDEGIREAMRGHVRRIHQYILDRFTSAGLPNPLESTKIFMGIGMLCNVGAALGLPELSPGSEEHQAL